MTLPAPTPTHTEEESWQNSLHVLITDHLVTICSIWFRQKGKFVSWHWGAEVTAGLLGWEWGQGGAEWGSQPPEGLRASPSLCQLDSLFSPGLTGFLKSHMFQTYLHLPWCIEDHMVPKQNSPNKQLWLTDRIGLKMIIWPSWFHQHGPLSWTCRSIFFSQRLRSLEKLFLEKRIWRRKRNGIWFNIYLLIAYEIITNNFIHSLLLHLSFFLNLVHFTACWLGKDYFT